MQISNRGLVILLTIGSVLAAILGISLYAAFQSDQQAIEKYGKEKFEEGQLIGLQKADKGYIGGYNDAVNDSRNQSIALYNQGTRDGYRIGYDAAMEAMLGGIFCNKTQLNEAHNTGFDLGHESTLGQPKMAENLPPDDMVEYMVLRNISYAEILNITQGKYTSSDDDFQIVIPHYKGINGTFNESSAGWGMPEFLWLTKDEDNKAIANQTEG